MREMTKEPAIKKSNAQESISNFFFGSTCSSCSLFCSESSSRNQLEMAWDAERYLSISSVTYPSFFSRRDLFWPINFAQCSTSRSFSSIPFPTNRSFFMSSVQDLTEAKSFPLTSSDLSFRADRDSRQRSARKDISLDLVVVVKHPFQCLILRPVCLLSLFGSLLTCISLDSFLSWNQKGIHRFLWKMWVRLEESRTCLEIEIFILKSVS